MPLIPFCCRRFANLAVVTIQIITQVAIPLIEFELHDSIVNFRKPCNSNLARILGVSGVAPEGQKSDQNYFLSGFNSIIESHEETISAL